MSQSQKNSKQKSIPTPANKSFLERIQECLDAKDTVEVLLTNEYEVTGILTIIGSDFIGVSSAIERTIETSAQGQDGAVEKQQIMRVYELETFIKFEEIRAISRVLKSRTK